MSLAMTGTALPLPCEMQANPIGCLKDQQPTCNCVTFPCDCGKPRRNPCLRHQAPSGFRYVDAGGHCVLMNLSTGQVVPQAAPVAMPTTVSNVFTSTTNSLKAWAQNNQGLAIAIGLIGGYVIWKKIK